MGCDIHLQVEVRTPEGWKATNAPESFERDPWDLEQLEECKARALVDGPSQWDMTDYYRDRVKRGWYRDRNYLLFAVLANVRNGYGFAGVPTHEPIDPITPQRGLPEDRDRSVLDSDGERYDFGDHSHSWLTLREMLEYPGWEHRFEACGVIPREDFLRITPDWNRERPPPLTGWCGAVSGHAVIQVDEREPLPPTWTHIRVYWNESVADGCTRFRDMMNVMCELADSPDNVRMVFGFDS